MVTTHKHKLREIRVGAACSSGNGGLVKVINSFFYCLQTNISTRNIVIKSDFSFLINNLTNYDFGSNSSHIKTNLVIPPASTAISGGAVNV